MAEAIGDLVYYLRGSLQHVDSDIAELNRKVDAAKIVAKVKLEAPDVDKLARELETKLGKAIKINLDTTEAQRRITDLESRLSRMGMSGPSNAPTMSPIGSGFNIVGRSNGDVTQQNVGYMREQALREAVIRPGGTATVAQARAEVMATVRPGRLPALPDALQRIVDNPVLRNVSNPAMLSAMARQAGVPMDDLTAAMAGQTTPTQQIQAMTAENERFRATRRAELDRAHEQVRRELSRAEARSRMRGVEDEDFRPLAPASGNRRGFVDDLPAGMPRPRLRMAEEYAPDYDRMQRPRGEPGTEGGRGVWRRRPLTPGEALEGAEAAGGEGGSYGGFAGYVARRLARHGIPPELGRAIGTGALPVAATGAALYSVGHVGQVQQQGSLQMARATDVFQREQAEIDYAKEGGWRHGFGVPILGGAFRNFVSRPVDALEYATGMNGGGIMQQEVNLAERQRQFHYGQAAAMHTVQGRAAIMGSEFAGTGRIFDAQRAGAMAAYQVQRRGLQAEAIEMQNRSKTPAEATTARTASEQKLTAAADQHYGQVTDINVAQNTAHVGLLTQGATLSNTLENRGAMNGLTTAQGELRAVREEVNIRVQREVSRRRARGENVDENAVRLEMFRNDPLLAQRYQNATQGVAVAHRDLGIASRGIASEAWGAELTMGGNALAARITGINESRARALDNANPADVANINRRFDADRTMAVREHALGLSQTSYAARSEELRVSDNPYLASYTELRGQREAALFGKDPEQQKRINRLFDAREEGLSKQEGMRRRGVEVNIERLGTAATVQNLQNEHRYRSADIAQIVGDTSQAIAMVNEPDDKLRMQTAEGIRQLGKSRLRGVITDIHDRQSLSRAEGVSSYVRRGEAGAKKAADMFRDELEGEEKAKAAMADLDKAKPDLLGKRFRDAGEAAAQAAGTAAGKASEETKIVGWENLITISERIAKGVENVGKAQ